MRTQKQVLAKRAEFQAMLNEVSKTLLKNAEEKVEMKPDEIKSLKIKVDDLQTKIAALDWTLGYETL